MNSEGELIGGLLTIFIVASAIVLSLVASIFIIPSVIVGGVVWWGYHSWKNDPARKEKITRQRTLDLYEDTLRVYEDAAKVEWPFAAEFHPIADQLLSDEVGSGAVPLPPAITNSIEGARYRDRLAKLGSVTDDTVHEAAGAIIFSLREIKYQKMPADTMVPVHYLLGSLGRTIRKVIDPFFSADGFYDLRRTIEGNLEAAGDVYPEDYKHDDVVEVYLKGTPLVNLFDVEVPFGISNEKFYQHGLLIAGTGYGKSQGISWFIKNKLDDLKEGKCSIIVMDSQTELIESLLNADLPDERVIHVDPNDIDYPIAISLFDLGMARASEYSKADKERVVNGAIEVLTFIMNNVIGVDLTPKMTTMFNFLIRLLIHIPDSTLHTMREILGPDGHVKYQEYIDQLSPTAQAFFAEEYPNNKQYGETRQHVRRRIFDMLEKAVFDRMFASPNSKFDLFVEMNAGRLILLNTDKSLLKDDGTELLGRLYLSMLNVAIQERALIKSRLPVYFFCDEAADYVKNNTDTTINTMLEQARKMNVGTMWCAQQLSLFDAGMQASFMANTSIKMFCEGSVSDAGKLAKEMRTTVDFLLGQPALTFATFIKGDIATAVPLKIPYGSLASLPQRDQASRERLRDMIRERYSANWRPDRKKPPDPTAGYLEYRPKDKPPGGSGSETEASDEL